MPYPDGLYVETVRVYTPEIAAGIGRLMPQLDPSFPDTPIPEDRLRYIIDSSEHDQLIAVASRIGIVGAATMSIVRGAGFGARGQLEDFVTDGTAGIRGAGSMLWHEAMMKWCIEKKLDGFYLQTETWRNEAGRNAIEFYQRAGATLLDGTVTFSAKVPK
jgi:hypothetical protein